MEARLDPSDPDVKSIVPKIRRKDLVELSFAFKAVEEAWSDDLRRRTLLQVELQRGDVSLVAWGANEATSVAMRAGDRTVEQRQRTAEAISQQRQVRHSFYIGESKAAARKPLVAERSLKRDDTEALMAGNREREARLLTWAQEVKRRVAAEQEARAENIECAEYEARAGR